MREVTRMVNVFEDAYQRGGLIAPPEKVLQMLQENGQLIDLIMRTRGAAFGQGFRITERDRNLAIRQARWTADTNINIEKAVQIWTDFGLGQRVQLRSEDTAANTLLTEFWTAQRNAPIIGQRSLHERSEDALNEGELLFAFWYSPLDGEATIRRIPTDQVEIIWEDPDSQTIPLFYRHRRSTKGDLYYPDWRASEAQLGQVPIPRGARRADMLADGTVEINGRPEAVTKVVAMWAVRNRNHTLGRGMPQFLNAFEWATVLQDFMGDRAAVARKAAMYTEKVKIDGGSRVVGQFKSRLQSGLVQGSSYRDNNPPAAAASDWIENEAVNREWMARDTGAASARFDGRMLGGQLSVATGIGLHWLGFPDAISGGLATAEEMKTPFYQQIERYQLWLSSVLEEIGQVVLFLRAENGGGVDPQAAVVAMMETPLFVLIEELTRLMTETVAAVTAGVLDQAVGSEVLRQLYLVALQKIGVRNPAEIFTVARAAEARLPEALAAVMANWREGRLGDAAVVQYLLGELEELAGKGMGR
jgi:hypothetical protein